MNIQYSDNETEAACDEAGRGCLAGPVCAAAVIVNKNFDNPKINDSKQLTEKDRIILRKYIEENAVAFSIAFIEPKIIDEINILNASILAMHLALDGLSISPELIVVDGNRFKNYKEIPHQCIIKGDTKFQNIAAASILAKTYRDEYMEELHSVFPVYNWKQNKGYPTKEHRKVISEFGITTHHRKSFRLLTDQLSLDI